MLRLQPTVHITVQTSFFQILFQVRCTYPVCKVCPDIYECNCHEGLIADVACKHVHSVHTKYGDKLVDPILVEPQQHHGQDHVTNNENVDDIGVILSQELKTNLKVC